MSKVSICGICRTEDVDYINHCAPDYVGIVFSYNSRHRVDPEDARRLKRRLSSGMQVIGVFQNQSVEQIASLCGQGIIDLVQLNGQEDEAFVKNLRKSASCKIIRTVVVGAEPPALPTDADYLRFDSATAVWGGSGRDLDWQLLKGCGQSPFFLAGGLDGTRVRLAIRALNPYCVEANEGVETGGYKDPVKIGRFINLAKNAV